MLTCTGNHKREGEQDYSVTLGDPRMAENTTRNPHHRTSTPKPLSTKAKPNLRTDLNHDQPTSFKSLGSNKKNGRGAKGR